MVTAAPRVGLWILAVPPIIFYSRCYLHNADDLDDPDVFLDFSGDLIQQMVDEADFVVFSGRGCQKIVQKPYVARDVSDTLVSYLG